MKKIRHDPMDVSGKRVTIHSPSPFGRGAGDEGLQIQGLSLFVIPFHPQKLRKALLSKEKGDDDAYHNFLESY
jgi:hypothetical protein